MTRTADAIVIGAGIVGAACAEALTDVDVEGLERGASHEVNSEEVRNVRALLWPAPLVADSSDLGKDPCFDRPNSQSPQPRATHTYLCSDQIVSVYRSRLESPNLQRPTLDPVP